MLLLLEKAIFSGVTWTAAIVGMLSKSLLPSIDAMIVAVSASSPSSCGPRLREMCLLDRSSFWKTPQPCQRELSLCFGMLLFLFHSRLFVELSKRPRGSLSTGPSMRQFEIRDVRISRREEEEEGRHDDDDR